MDNYNSIPPLVDDISDSAAIPHGSNGSSCIPNYKKVKIYDSSDENEWSEEDVDEPMAGLESKCLFCNSIQKKPYLVFTHMVTQHKFDMFAAASQWDLDQISYIKFINYVRKHKPSADCLRDSDSHLWNSDDYMKPISDGDALLTFDAEDFYASDEEYSEEEDIETIKASRDEWKYAVERHREALRRIINETCSGRYKKIRTVSDIDAEEDEGYFNSYAYFDIHHEMLSDKVRTEAYRSAILNNEALFVGKSVLDVGCGTAILSMFAAKVGGNVIAVDMSDVIFQAMEVVKENDLEDAISLRKGKLEDLRFISKFDIIVSEWMGYFLLFEGMLDSVIYARTHYLAPGGTLLPNRCTLHLLGAEDLDSFKKAVLFWHDVYGFKMSSMIKQVIKEASTEIVKEECICTNSFEIADFDLMTVTPDDTEFSCDFALTCERDGSLTSFVGYFDTFFHLPNPVFFSTGPKAAPTHWKQTIFYLPNLRPFKKGEVLNGNIAVKRKRKEIRSLDVVITFDNKKLHYFVE